MDMLNLVGIKNFLGKIKFLISGVDHKDLGVDMVEKDSWLDCRSDDYTDSLWELEENQVLLHYEKLDGGKENGACKN